MKPLTWLENKEIELLKWPSRSPDLSPIENIWAFMKAQALKRQEEIQSKEDLEQVMDEVF